MSPTARLTLLAILLALAANLGNGSPADAATFVVNYADDEPDLNPGDGICDIDSGPPLNCSLRAAAEEADAFPGHDRVELPPAAPGEPWELNLLSVLGGGPISLKHDTEIVGIGPQPIEVLGGAETSLPVFVLDGEDHDPAIENLAIRCRQAATPYSGVEAARRGVLRGSVVTGCGIGVRSRLGGDVLVDGTLVEENVYGVVHEGGLLHLRDAWIRRNTGETNGFGAGVVSAIGGEANGLLRIERSLISENTAGRGAGLALEDLSLAVVVNSTISGNRSTGDGGGVIALFGSELELASSTVAFNQADSDGNGSGDGGGLWISGDSLLTMRNSILSHNTAAGPLVLAWDCVAPSGVLLPGGYNVVHHSLPCVGVSADPTNTFAQSADLGSLEDHGGPTLTHAPLVGSPAIDHGDPSGCAVDGDFDPGSPLVGLAVDQRGFDRHVDGDGDLVARCDAGALEVGALFADGFESGDTLAWSSSVG